MAELAVPEVGDDPLSSLVAVSFVGSEFDWGAQNVSELSEFMVDCVARGILPDEVEFPLAADSTDTVRAITALQPNVIVSWLDPLTEDESAEAPRFGSNADYTAYFGDGAFDVAAGGGSAIFAGMDDAGWIWVNHEYISNARPGLTNAPEGQHLTLSKFLAANSILTNDIMSDIWTQADIDTHTVWHKRQLGGSWMHLSQDPVTKMWSVDRDMASVRYDSTSNTLSRVTGISLSGDDQTDGGDPLPSGVVSGIMGDCSGAQTPWGTVISAEENVQSYYGDLETSWARGNKFVPETGFDPGAPISFDPTPSTGGSFGTHSDPNQRHARDFYGYLVEMHPGAAPGSAYDDGTGEGHRKLGAMGRARWENATFALNENWEPIDGAPIVIYAANDRRGGRVFKFVSSGNYEAGMSIAETRALLNDGTVFVAHMEGLENETGLHLDDGDEDPETPADDAGTDSIYDGRIAPTEEAPGTGRWVELSLTSTDIAPNAAALGEPTKTVGEALQDNSWNGIGGFTTDDDVRRALFTASMKIGAMEQNRPEDLEYNPKDGLIYVAYTKHGRQVGLKQDGTLFDPDEHAEASPTRPDPYGAIFAYKEMPNNTFEYFLVWDGDASGDLDADGNVDDEDYRVANPDNMLIDRDGGVFFGTDGNFGTHGHADSLYYLDRDPTHDPAVNSEFVMKTYNVAFRLVAGPSDSEATGPSLTTNGGTLFFSVQHPGESEESTWPQPR